MSTPPRKPLHIRAEYLGPVISLDAQLTKELQTLVYARNGIGKSFLGRALRYLDLHGQGLPIVDAANDLVSDESHNGTGSLSLRRGTVVKANLELERIGNISEGELSDTIIHVFSDDFVQQELRHRKYEIDGEIENQIAVDSENIRLKDAYDALELARSHEQQAIKDLEKKFEKEKTSELREKARINSQLSEYKQLKFENCIYGMPERPSPPTRSFTDLLGDLDNLRALPSQPTYPGKVDTISIDGVDLVEIAESLEHVTTPSTASEEIKKKIDAHHEFYETGTNIVQHDDRTNCPFCEQDITAVDPKSVIDSYIKYFEDEEEKHKSNLRTIESHLILVENSVQNVESVVQNQKSKYDALKLYVPSFRDSDIDSCEVELQKVLETISLYNPTLTPHRHVFGFFQGKTVPCEQGAARPCI